MAEAFSDRDAERVTGPRADAEEEAVLGAMMVSRGACALVTSAGLRAEHFASEKHRAIFQAISHLLTHNEGVDFLTVMTRLKEMPPVGGAGRDYVSSLASTVPVAGNAAHYAKAVLEAAELRSKLRGAQRVIEGVHARDRSAIQKGIEEQTHSLSSASVPKHKDELADEFLEDVYREEPGVVYETPWRGLNRLLSGGMYPGDVTSLVAWPGMGKSTFVDVVLTHVQEQGYATAIFDTEMRRKQRMARFASRKTGIPYKAIRMRELNEEMRREITQAMNHVPFDYFIKPQSVDAICQELAVLDVDVAVIDTVHRLPYKDETGLREMTNMLAEAALHTDTHLLFVCHMNMARAKEAQRPKPVLRDILGSGAIEQASSNVISVHRDQAVGGAAKEDGIFGVLKSRDGLQGEIKMRLIPGSYGFESVKPAPVQEEMGVPETDDEAMAA